LHTNQSIHQINEEHVVTVAFEFNPAHYGDVLADLIGEARLNPLDAGQPDQAAYPALSALTVDQAFAGQTVRDQSMAEACLSALWLYHNYLDESHTLSQSITSDTGSYWHGIMHRREPDPPNAKYWFRRVGPHPVFDQLAPLVAALAVSAEADQSTAFLASQTQWDPYAFIDLCDDAMHGRSSLAELCRQIQLLEWQLLFHYSYQHAVGQD
jgi:hypothetical protein